MFHLSPPPAFSGVRFLLLIFLVALLCGTVIFCLQCCWGVSKWSPKTHHGCLLLETWTPFTVSCLHTSRCPLWKLYSFVWVEKLIYEKQICKHRTRYSLLWGLKGMHTGGESLNVRKTSEEDSKKKNRVWGSDSELSMGTEPKFKLINKQKGKRYTGLATPGESRVSRYRREYLWAFDVSPCIHLQSLPCLLPAITPNNAFQIVCFQCRAWITGLCEWVSGLMSFLSRHIGSLLILLPTPPKPCLSIIF